MPQSSSTTGLILAGGRARRMDQRDKGLVGFRGRPLVVHVIERFAPQVDALLISANRNLDAYAAFGAPVIADDSPEFLGPLAGLAAGLACCSSELLATAPCDTPFLPRDLVARLHTALQAQDAEAAVARLDTAPEPAFMLVRRDSLDALNAFLTHGGRKIADWHATLKLAYADFSDMREAFANINTPEDLQRLERSSNP